MFDTYYEHCAAWERSGTSAALHGSVPAAKKTSATLHGNVFELFLVPNLGPGKRHETFIFLSLLTFFGSDWRRGGAEEAPSILSATLHENAIP